MAKHLVTVRVAAETPIGRARSRRRRVPKASAACWAELAREARDAGEWRYIAQHGGTVPNNYGYPAWTETVLAIASPDGDVVLWYGSQSANKATCTFGGDLFDGRVKSSARHEACRAAHRARHADALADDFAVTAVLDPIEPAAVEVGSELHISLEAAFANAARARA